MNILLTCFRSFFRTDLRERLTRLSLLAAVLLSCAPGAAVSAAETDRTVPVQLLVPEIGSVQWIERSTGQLVAPRRASLEVKARGRVGQVLVREGDRVRKDQPLAVLDLEDANLGLDQAVAGSKAVESQVAAARAAVETARVGRQQAEIRLETATLEFERTKSLRAKETVSQQQYDQMEGQFKLAKNGVDVAERQVRQAESALAAVQSQLAVAAVGIRNARQRLTDSTLVAPFDGLIVSKSIMEYEQSERQTIVLVDDSELELRIRLPERVLPHLTLGARVLVRSPLVAEPVETTINTIIPAIDPRTLTFESIAIIRNEAQKLSHGGYAEAEVVVREDREIPIVPENIVRITDAAKSENSQGAPRAGHVFTVRDGKAHQTPVTVGIQRNNRVAILSGLASGTPVVDLGFEQLAEGTPVTVATFSEAAR